MIGFWHRTRQGSKSKISTILFNFTKKLSDENKYETKWGSKIKAILNSIGLSYLWNFLGINSTQLKNVIKEKLRDVFLQNWQSEVANNNLCSNYRILKLNFGQEYYIKALPKELRIIISKFRSGSHNLPISDKRYHPIDERNVCSLCFSDIGDEYHYVLSCSAFDHIRSSYIHPVYTSRPNTLKFHKLFSCTKLSTLIKLAKFIKIIMFVFR